MAAIEIEPVRQFVADQLPTSWTVDRLSDDVGLGEQGIGLDSVGLVELVLACEERFEIAMPIEEVLEEEPTVGLLVKAIELELRNEQSAP